MSDTHHPPHSLSVGSRCQLIHVTPGKHYKTIADVEPVVHVRFDDGAEWMGLDFEDLLPLAHEPPVMPARDDAPALGEAGRGTIAGGVGLANSISDAFSKAPIRPEDEYGRSHLPDDPAMLRSGYAAYEETFGIKRRK